LLVLIDRPLDAVEQDLLDRARQSVPVLLAGPTVRALSPDSPLVEASGLMPGRTTPAHELQFSPGPDGARMAARLGDFRPHDSWVIPDKLADDVERLLMVRHEMGEHPICTWRPSTGLGMFTLGTSPSTLANPSYQRLVGRWLRHALGVEDAPPVQVGLLGTPDTAAIHHAAIDVTEGLELLALCDGGSGRPGGRTAERPVRRINDPDELVNDPDIGLVIVATPNHTHVEWVTRALEAGKHAVVHAPFCLSTHEADDLATLAMARSLVLAMYPDRREDPGYQALRAAVRRGSVGDVLWLETVQGGLRRPAGGWHDDERISGGLVHDRGFAHLDWALDLVGEPVEWVSATSHKRVWHHVTNADHVRVLLHFANGTEAQITISDLVSAPVARFHLLGTAGEVFSDRIEERGDTGTRSGRHAGRTDRGGDPAPLTLVTHEGLRSRLPLPAPGPSDFHRELADCLMSGWPLTGYQADAARRVVAVAEAATRSATAGGGQISPA
jgi:predicted dehydrogenase